MYSDMDWRIIGPFRAGHAVAVSGIKGDGTTLYFGSVDGGVWKTTRAGTTWKPIFDGHPAASTGALAVAPSNPKVIYAGTGETDIRSDLASGSLYVSGSYGTVQSWDLALTGCLSLACPDLRYRHSSRGLSSIRWSATKDGRHLPSLCLWTATWRRIFSAGRRLF